MWNPYGKGYCKDTTIDRGDTKNTRNTFFFVLRASSEKSGGLIIILVQYHNSQHPPKIHGIL